MQDLIIIGSGPGGYHTAEYAASKGLKVTIIERAEAGGTCLNRGCIPTKALCRTAEVMDIIAEAETLGIGGCAPKLDFRKAMERKDEVVSQLRSGVEQLMSRPGITFIRGEASLIGNAKMPESRTIEHSNTRESELSSNRIFEETEGHSVLVNGEKITARNIIIATGSRPKRLPIPGIDLDGVEDSTSLLSLKEKPESLIVVGAGVIGMEMASVMNSFGVKVTVVEFMKECLPMLDDDIAKRLRQSIGKRGVEFYMQSACKEIRRNGQMLDLIFERKSKEETISAEKVLIATGREAQTDGLNLDALGIETSRGAIVTDDNFETNIPGIYAIGDVNAKCMLAHAATMQGIHVINSILDNIENLDNVDKIENIDITEKAKPAPHPIRHDIMPSAIFTRPEAATVGLTEDKAKELLGEKPVIRKAMYRANGKALAMNEPEGLVKLIADNSGTILGCHVFGTHAADIVQEVTALMNQNATLNDLAAIIHIHPTIGEIVWEAAL